jgi:predicted ATPase
MKKIWFKNFRRFAEFPELDYGPITFLVGRNNSGKSTFVKAILLIDNYLKSDKIDFFSFTDKILEDANIVTFGRAKNKSNENEHSISFTFQIEDFEVFIDIMGDQNDTSAWVAALFIKNINNGYYYNFTKRSAWSITDFIIGKTEIQIADVKEPDLMTLEYEIQKLWHLIMDSKEKKTSKGYIELTDKYYNLLGKKELITKNCISKEDNNEIVTPISNTGNYSACAMIEEIASIYDIIEKGLDFIADDYKSSLVDKYWDENNSNDVDLREIYVSFKGVYDDRFQIEKTFNKFLKLIKSHIYIYLGSNSVKQNALFAIKDTHNPLAQAINEYKQLHIDLRPNCTSAVFTRKWMKEFEIGDDLIIEMHAGEAYEVKIISDNSEIPLADKGMGSIQAMLLILRLACIIHKYGESYKTITVVVEEPELNLHPALQSKLADLFLHVNQLKSKKVVNCNVEFIIETHSEYLIRKTQLLVKENEFEVKPNENPFHVIYFDKEMKQWKMNYREDGKFIEEFGNGFYDESSLLTLNLL